MSIHPRFGGWFGLRGIFIFKNVCVPTMPHVPPQDILSDEQKIEVLDRFNGNWRDGKFRDIIPVEDTYSEVQRIYFGTWPKDRKPLIEQMKEQILKENGGQSALDVNDMTYGIHQMSVSDSDETHMANGENQTCNNDGGKQGTETDNKQNNGLHLDSAGELKTSDLNRCNHLPDDKWPKLENVWTKNVISTENV